MKRTGPKVKKTNKSVQIAKERTSPPGRGRAMFRNLALAALVAAVLGHLASPDFLGFTVLPLAAALLLGLLAGPAQWRADWGVLSSPFGRARLGAVLGLILFLAPALAVGLLYPGPTFDFSQDRALALAPETLELLSKLDRPVTVTVHLGPQSQRLLRVRELMNLYARAAKGHLSIKYINPQTEADYRGGGPGLVSPDTAELRSEDFVENISPISEDRLNGALTRLLHPEGRLVYFLNTFGEKLLQETGPGGLSQWAADLSDRRLMALDYYWNEGAPLPLEASVLVLAGPKAPLGESRETWLLNYVKNGGRLLVMADPLTVAFSPEFWQAFGLQLPDGLVVDPETNLAGTGEVFIVSHDYPAHTLTQGLSSPVIWPLAGCFTIAENQDPSIKSKVYAIAQSSVSSWLETDRASLAARAPRYQADSDRPGPLALGLALEIEGGGRLVVLADSDLAANGFRGFPGNRNFSSATIHWLLDGESLSPSQTDKTQNLSLSRISARLVFWLPTVVWPAFILGLWLFFHLRRHRRH
jgi:hypothetical protein